MTDRRAFLTTSLAAAATSLLASHKAAAAPSSRQVVHAISGDASTTQPAKILAMVFTPKGQPAIKPGGDHRA